MIPSLSIPRAQRATVGFLAVGVVVLIAYELTESVWLETALVLALTLATFVAVAAVARRAGIRSAWTLLAASSALWFAGWIRWQIGVLQTGAPPVSFSVADALFMSSYVLLVGGLLKFVSVREPRGGGAVESAMIAVVAALASWLTLIGPALEHDVLVGEAGWTQAAYAILDVLIVAVLARALLGTLRDTAYLLLLGSIVFLLAADSAWNWLYLAGSYSAGGYSDLGWIAFSILMGAAALHPSAGDLARPIAVPRHNNWRRLAVFVAAGAALPALFWLEFLTGVHELDSVVVDIGKTVLMALVLTRAFMLLGESERLRLTLAEQNTELKELDRLKDEFVASVSHELRTPLTSIRGYLELVREGEAGELTADQDDFLAIVDRNAERLLRVVGDLLFVAQLDAGALPLERALLDPAQLARQAADSARPVADERGIKLSLELGRLPDEFSGDETRLAQALDNLVANALKFTPSGGTVEVRAAASNGSVELTVADSGPGISDRDQQRLFQRFFRTQEASDQAVPGTGLGLAITKAIVEAHGGTVGVSSEIGHGTEFRIILPTAA